MLTIIFFSVLFLFSSFGATIVSSGSSKVAIFAGGCFWCMEPPFENTIGVLDVVSGYTGGKTVNPTYGEVSSGATGH